MTNGNGWFAQAALAATRMLTTPPKTVATAQLPHTPNPVPGFDASSNVVQIRLLLTLFSDSPKLYGACTEA